MMPFRSGYEESRPWVSWNDFWSSSLPYATVTSWILAYSGFFSSCFISSIQAFWFVAFGVADRIAIFPDPPIWSEMSLTWFSAMPCAVAWLTNTSRQFLLVSESNVTTFAPPWRAWLIAPQIAFGSFAEIAMTFEPCWVSVLMYDTWEDADASDGPTSLYLPLN